MIGPFSTTLVPLSSSSSVDRQILINVEASAISPDERTFGLIFTQIPFTSVRMKKEKKIKELGPDRPYFQFVSVWTSHHCFWYTNFTNIAYYVYYIQAVWIVERCVCVVTVIWLRVIFPVPLIRSPESSTTTSALRHRWDLLSPSILLPETTGYKTDKTRH